MRNKITINEPDIVINQNISTSEPRTVPMPGLTGKRAAIDIIKDEGSEDFASYIEWLGLSKDPDILVLSSLHHYYYDAEEMKNIRTVVSMIRLNQIKEVSGFLNSMFHLLPSKSYFIASFTHNQKKKRSSAKKSSDNKTKKESEAIENGISSGIPFLRTLYQLLDSKINKQLSTEEVTQMLTDKGFRILDMTEINGITFFCARKTLTLVK